MTLHPFNFNGSEVRVHLINDEPWFVAADVCSALNIANTSDALNGLDQDEQAGIAITDISSNGTVQRRDVLAVNEPGLYSLVLRSRKPEAKAFKRWITHEVLPAIRKTGRYEVQSQLPTTYIEALEALVSAEKAKAQLQIENAEMKPKAEFFDAVAGSDDTIGMNEAAKLAKVGMGRNTLMARLREDGIFLHNNTPAQEYIDRGYFKVVESKWTDSKGDSHVTLSTRVFQRGIEFIRRKFASV